MKEQKISEKMSHFSTSQVTYNSRYLNSKFAQSLHKHPQGQNADQYSDCTVKNSEHRTRWGMDPKFFFVARERFGPKNVAALASWVMYSPT